MRLRVLIAIAVLLGGVLVYRTYGSTQRFGEALAYTECPVFGDARVTVSDRVAPEDTFPVRLHEEVHASQCRELGPWRYRLRNLTTRGKLALEAPGYCAGAHARLAMGQDSARVRERVMDDAAAAFAGLASETTVREALRRTCRDVIP